MPAPLVTIQTDRGPVEVPADVAQRLGLRAAPLGGEEIASLLGAPQTPAFGGPQTAQLTPQTAADFTLPGQEVLPPRAEEARVPGASLGTSAPPSRPTGPGQLVAPPGIEEEQQLRTQHAQAEIAQAAEGGPAELEPEVAEATTATEPQGLPSVSLTADGFGVLRGVPQEMRQRVIDTLQTLVGPGHAQVRGNDVVFDQDAAGTLAAEFPELRQGLLDAVGSAQLQGEPDERRRGTGTRAFLETQFSETIRPGVPAALADAFSQQSEKLEALQQEALAGRVDANQVLEQAFAEFAQVRAQHQQTIEESEGEASRQMRSRIEGLERGIQAVAQRRINPEAWFGTGAGRRMGAAIAVAMGHLASALGGGPNTAYQILQERIQQNIAAQESTLANERAALGLQSNALAYFRAQLGDERAAREAAMAAQWEEVLNRTRSQLTNARSPVLQANGNALIVAARLQQLRHLANAHSSAWELTRQTTERVPVRPGTGAQAAASRQAVQAFDDLTHRDPQEAARVQQEAAQAQEQAAAQRSQRRRRPRPQAPDAPEGSSDEPIRLTGGPLSSIEATRAERFSQLTRAAGEGQGRRAAPLNVRPARGRGEDADRIFNRLPEQVQTRVWETAQSAATFSSTMPRLIELARQYPDVFESEASGEARALALQAQGAIRQMLDFGALTGNENEIVRAVVNNPEELGTRVLFGDEAGSLQGAFTGIMRAVNGRLSSTTGLMLNSPGATSREE